MQAKNTPAEIKDALIRSLHATIDEQGRRIIALQAQIEQVEQLEQQLDAADTEIRELKAALVVAKLPAESQSNVIQMLGGVAA